MEDPFKQKLIQYIETTKVDYFKQYEDWDSQEDGQLHSQFQAHQYEGMWLALVYLEQFLERESMIDTKQL